MKVLLTGASGFIGNYLAWSWKDGPFELICLARSNKRPMPEGARVKYCDLAEGIPLDEKVGAIVHTAAQSRALGVTDNDFVRNNVEATRQLIKYAGTSGVRRIVYFSSICIYGKIASGKLRVSTPMVGPDIYGSTKYAAELLFAGESKKISIVALRLPGVIGKGATSPWLATVAKKIRDGEPVEIYNPDALFNNIVYLDDLEQFIRQLLGQESKPGFKPLTLGCAHPLTVRESVERLMQSMGKSSPIIVKTPTAPAFTIDIEEAKAIGYRARSAGEILDLYAKECCEP